MVEPVDVVSNTWDEGDSIELLSTAFNCVVHEILLEKLYCFGILKKNFFVKGFFEFW